MIGRTISHYKITEKLGEGGMGVVYKAEDTKLERPVALKFLAAHAIEDPEHKARFVREAKAAARLDHPNICHVYEIDEADGQTFLAMAFLEGRTVKDKIAERPLKLDEALDIAVQTAQGLKAAHQKEIVHRDIKPANLMLTEEDQVKIMDFGLAQLADRSKLTKTTTMLGTPAYMSPEQAQRQPTDRRTDIWSLGVVIYEMVAGRLPFEAEREEAVAYSIVHEEPEPLTAQRVDVPVELDRIVSKAMAKEPGERYQHVEDLLVDLRAVARENLDQAGKSAASLRLSPKPLWQAWRTYTLWAVTALLAVALAAVWGSRSPGPEAPILPVRLVIPVPSGHQLPIGASYPLDVSPDGSKLVYVASAEGTSQLYLRPIDDFDATALPGTQGAQEPFFSPDGGWVGFVADSQLMKVSLLGGAPVALGSVDGLVQGASWAVDDSILYGTEDGLWRVSANGGEPEQISISERHLWPQHLPGGRAVLVTKADGYINVISLETGETRQLLAGKMGRYLPTGHLVFARQGGIWAVAFDLQSLQIRGGPFSVLDDVYDGSASGATYFRVTDSGALFYVPGRNDHFLVKVNRSGHPTPLTKRRAGYRHPRVSPDARRVAVTIDPPDEGKSDIWIFDIERDSFLRLTTQEHNLAPVWTPDGQRVFWGRGGDPFWKAADGSGDAERLVAMPGVQAPRSITPDGKVLLVASPIPRWGAQVDIWGLSLDGNADAFPILDSPFSERGAAISPNGRWLAYASNQSGRYEVYVQRFPEGGRRWAVSTEGGRYPVWSRDGREFFFIEGNRMMVAPVQTGDEFTAGRPVFLFDRPDLTTGEAKFDVLGNDFVMVQRDPLSMLSEFRVVQNFSAEIERLSPTAE